MLELNNIKISERWLFSSFEVMKYNPIYRDSSGKYIKDEWTDYSDIGKILNGVVLTFLDYKKFEDKYIEAISYLFKFYNCDKIQCIIERYYRDDDLEIINSMDLEKFYYELRKRKVLSLEETLKAARLHLRGAISGRFYMKGNKDISVRFGYDFYMYFNVPEINKKEIRNYIESKIGLFTTR